MRPPTPLALLAILTLPAAQPGPAGAESRFEATGEGWRLDRARIVDETRARVLLIGDSILDGYDREVIRALGDDAYVDTWVNPHHQSEDLNRRLAGVLTQGPYDVVHFNMGLHGWQEGRIRPGTFEPLTRAYVEVLQRHLPGAALIWASSTPVTRQDHPAELDPEINPVIVEHNRLAAGVMREMGVPVNDFHTALDARRTLAKGDRFHWTPPASRLLGDMAVSAIRHALGGAARRAATGGEFFITRTWSQEKDFRRPYFVTIPGEEGTGDGNHGRWPVLIFLHGNGGNAEGARRAFLRRYPEVAREHILVFGEGYRKSWNIVSERSKADDRAYVEAIVTRLATCANVRPEDFTLMGSSNGAALVNQVAIETRLPHFRHFITLVSPLNTRQHDGRHFRARGGDNRYLAIAEPLRGRRWLNVSGTDDRLVPYAGGPSSAIPAGDGRLGFVAAERSIHLWARHEGYTGSILPGPGATVGAIEVFDYLGGNVVHLKVNGGGHDAGAALTERRLRRFLLGEPVGEEP